MLIETRELTLSNVDLGTLDESSAMTLFGDAYLHRLALDTQVAPTEMTDAEGKLLYPGFFWTHLKVPPTRRLEQNKLWDRVAVGVDICGFGGMILDSTYVLGRAGELPQEREAWALTRLPSMRGTSMFVVDDSRDLEPRPAVPKAGMVAPMTKLQKPPPSVLEFSKVQRQGTIDPDFPAQIESKQPIQYPLTLYRDLFPGHSVMFATFARILDWMERELIGTHAFPPFPVALSTCLSLLERETFYLGNCYEPGPVLGQLRAAFSSCEPTLYANTEDDLASAGNLTCVTDLYELRTGRLLVTSKAQKLLAVPAWQKSKLRDAERILAVYGRQNDGVTT